MDDQMPPMDGGMGEPMGGPMPQDNQQMMGDPNMGGGQMPPMGGGMGGPMPQGNQQMDNQFDTNFDAGVDADEEQDPKKYIQQLTGKLSQTLRKYNEDNGQPDVDLNKYVAGMVVKQATEGLSKDDADEIISKVRSGEDFEEGDDSQDNQEMMGDPNMGGGQMPPMDGGMGGPPPQDNQQMMPNESFRRRIIESKLDEIVRDVLSTKKDNDEKYQRPRYSGRYATKPYSSINFES